MSGDSEGHALSLARPMVFVGEKRLVGVRDLRGRRAQTATEIFKVTKYQVWSLTQFYSVDFSKLRVDVKKCVFNNRTIKVCVSCC